MKKTLIVSALLLMALAPLQSFTGLHNPVANEKIVFGPAKKKIATASDNTVLRVSIVINESTSAIIYIRVFADADCFEYSFVGYTGNVYQSGSDYYANNINIDLNGTDYVIVNGLLTNGLTECEGV